MSNECIITHFFVISNWPSTLFSKVADLKRIVLDALIRLKRANVKIKFVKRKRQVTVVKINYCSFFTRK